MPLLDLRINDALEETWRDFTAYVARRFTDEIRAEKWEWPRDPSPRDIKDTGDLQRSLDIDIKQGQLLSEFTWKAPYAPYVHDGAVFKRPGADGNPITMPPRPWTRPVLRDAETLQRYFRLRFAMAMRNRRGQQ
jgi:hypothetical protein